MNTGSFASIRFSVDSHTLTIIEADSTPLAPFPVSHVTIAVAQRYSVLLTANATVNPTGAYWMRAQMLTDMFRFEQIGQNTDVRGIIRYSDAESGDVLPGSLSDPDPGPGIEGLRFVDPLTELVPLEGGPPPDATVSYRLQISFQKTAQHEWLGFMNSTVTLAW
jgi:hypothetical protein